MLASRKNLPIIAAWILATQAGNALAECVLPHSTASYSTSAPSAFEFRSGVLIDATSSTAFLMNPAGGTEAVSLDSGKTVWHSNVAAKPLHLNGKRLLAQSEPDNSANQLSLVILDTENKGEVLQKFSVELPKNVSTEINDSLESKFRTRAYRSGERLIIKWEYAYKPVSGMERTNDDVADDVYAVGAVQVDMHTGTARTVTPDEVPPTTISSEFTQQLEGYIPSRPLWQVGEVWASAIYIKNNGKQQLVLRHWDKNTLAVKQDLALFVSGLTYRYPSADCNHLLASRADANSDPVWSWEIFSIESGEAIASIRNATPAAWFFINKTQLFHEARPASFISNGEITEEKSLRLRAVDLQTGKQLWEHTYRDTTYHGPYPATSNAPAMP